MSYSSNTYRKGVDGEHRRFLMQVGVIPSTPPPPLPPRDPPMTRGGKRYAGLFASSRTGLEPVAEPEVEITPEITSAPPEPTQRERVARALFGEPDPQPTDEGADEA